MIQIFPESVFSINDQVPDYSGKKRLLPSPEEQEELRRRIIDLGGIFSGAGFRWSLEGALAISLSIGRWLRVHKDVDLALDSLDLKMITRFLAEKGFGVFRLRYVIRDKVNVWEIEPVNSRDTASVMDAQRLQILRADKLGTAVPDKNLLPLHLHLRRRNEQGLAVGVMDVSLPEEWAQPVRKPFYGTMINLSHPAKCVYYKIHMDRHYDMEDLRELCQAGRVSLEDVVRIRDVLTREREKRRHVAEDLMWPILKLLKDDMDAKQAANVILLDPTLGARLGEAQRRHVHQFAALFATLPVKSPVAVTNSALRAFGVLASEEEWFGRLSVVEEWVRKVPKRIANLTGSGESEELSRKLFHRASHVATRGSECTS